MKISLVQMKIRDGDPLANLSHAQELLRRHPGADLYLLPEVWTTGYARNSWDDYVTQHRQTVLDQMRALAAAQNAWIGGSSIARRNDGRLVNRFSLIPPDTSPVISYDKVHLFALLGEDKRLTPGTQRVHAKVGEWRAALSICYDLRFPEMYRQSAVEGSQLFLIVAQWPEERCHHMTALARARAIENQAYVALCNRIGSASADLVFGGHSGIWGPDGEQLADAGQQEQVVSAEIDLASVLQLRKDFPFLASRSRNVDY